MGIPNLPMRATQGYDAAGKKIVNVGYADKTVGSDGVNVDFFKYENTVQEFSTTRAYPNGFAVIYQNRVYISTTNVAAGPWVSGQWRVLRTDPSWKVVISTSALEGILTSGDYVLSSVRSSDATYTLPNNPALGVPAVGDTIVIRDEANNLHDYGIVVNGNGKQIVAPTIGSGATYRITAPLSTTMFIYNGTNWTAQPISGFDFNGRLLSNSDYLVGEDFYRANVSDHIFRETQYGGGLKIRFPKYANHGDIIRTNDLDNMNPVTKTTFFVHPASNHTIRMAYGEQSATSFTREKSAWGMFIFDSRINTWRWFDGDNTPRWKRLASNYNATLGEKLYIANTDPLVPITITFPAEGAVGDSFVVDIGYVQKGTQIIMKVPDNATNVYIVPDDTIMKLPRVTHYRTMLTNPELFLTKSETITVENRASQWEWTLAKNGSYNAWTLLGATEFPFRVDRSDTDFPAMAAIATQTEVNKNKEDITTGQNRDCEAFVTPETLANKTATETRRGISRIATDTESKATSGTTEAWNATLITPQTLNNRLATTTMRGVMRIATQAQANAMTGSGETYTQIAITPQTLSARQSTETQTGITYQVVAGGTAQSARATAGTGVHDFAEHYRYVTPKTLFEKKASDTSQGMVFTATQAEANAGTANHANGPLAITAVTLHGRQATATLTGLSRSATEAEVLSITPITNTNVHVTPLELNKRTATETRHGFGETATQAEVDAGAAHNQFFITPLTFKTWQSYTHATVTAASGLTTTGNFWDGQNFDIQAATTTQRGTLRTATQAEANAMTSALDTVYITPNKLNARNATETLTGIIELATQTENDTGTDATRAVTPVKLLTSVRSGTNYRMTESRYGVGQMAVLTNDAAANTVWQGDTTAGSTRALTGYAHTDVVVSPRGLNTALANYLPLMATSQSSLSMTTAGGTKVMADDWIRRTVAQTVTGAMSFNADTTMNGRLKLYGTNNHISFYETDNSNKQWNIMVNEGAFVLDESGVATRLRIDTTGAAIFSSTVTSPVDPTANNHLTRWSYTEGRYMRKTGTLAETITGVKTFTDNLIVNKGASTVAEIQLGNSTGGLSVATNNAVSIGGTSVVIRPNGRSSTTSQSTFDASGNLTVAAQVKATAAAPLVGADLTRKDYVDQLVDDALQTAGQRVSKLGDTMTGTLTINAVLAAALNGAVIVDGVLTVKQFRIDAGNGEYLELRPNATTKSVDMVWIS